LSIRATEEPPPSLEPKPLPVKLIGAVVAVVLIAGVLVAGATNVIDLPFIGSHTVTELDSSYGWAITFPKAWNRHPRRPTDATTVRFITEGGGVGLRVQVNILPTELPADRIKETAPQLHDQIKQKGPDITILDDGTMGTLHGLPYFYYLSTYTDFSTGVAIPLEDEDYVLFNGANIEIITFETKASNYPKVASQFKKAMQTFRSRRTTLGVTPTVTPSK